MDEKLRKEFEAPTHFWMRNVAEFVRCAHRFKSGLEIGVCERRVDGKSILGIMTLAIQKGNAFFLEASGEDADKCITALEKCIRSMRDPAFTWEEDVERSESHAHHS